MDQFCIELAANLTTQYYSPTSYDFNAESLTSYLSKNGVLVTMCMLSPECDDLRPDMTDHWSGSWLQESTTGVRVINSGGVGVVLNPELVAPSCVYPIDGGTLVRDERGCGAFKFGRHTWLEKCFVIVYANYRKFRYFPSTAWEDIPCSEFFEDSDSDDYVASMIDHSQTWKSFTWLQMRDFENVLGHTVCFDDTVPNFHDDRSLLLYAGDTPWKLGQWNETMSTMKSIIDQHPSSKGIWNEVVFKMPPDNKLSIEMIQAVFFYGSWSREAAAREAERLGNLPLLQLNPFQLEGKVFRCETEGIGQSSVA